MDYEISKLKSQAEEYRYLYQINQVTREEAKEYITPYINAINDKQKELAEKYNQKVKKVTFISFIR